jgi:hypothetical protein
MVRVSSQRFVAPLMLVVICLTCLFFAVQAVAFRTSGHPAGAQRCDGDLAPQSHVRHPPQWRDLTRRGFVELAKVNGTEVVAVARACRRRFGRSVFAEARRACCTGLSSLASANCAEFFRRGHWANAQLRAFRSLGLSVAVDAAVGTC